MNNILMLFTSDNLPLAIGAIFVLSVFAIPLYLKLSPLQSADAGTQTSVNTADAGAQASVNTAGAGVQTSQNAVDAVVQACQQTADIGLQASPDLLFFVAETQTVKTLTDVAVQATLQTADSIVQAELSLTDSLAIAGTPVHHYDWLHETYGITESLASDIGHQLDLENYVLFN